MRLSNIVCGLQLESREDWATKSKQGQRTVRFRVLALPLGSFCILVAFSSWAAPIGINSALPLSKAEIVVREQLEIKRSSDRVAGENRDVERLESRTVIGYAPSSKLALFGMIPIVHARRNTGDVSDSESGLGDAVLFARYEVFRSDRPGRTFRIAPFVGVRVPTGRDGKTGDGSVDVFGGVIATLASTKWVLDSQVRYDFNREANRFERGNSAGLVVSFQYRLSPTVINQDTKGFVFGVLEVSANHHRRNRMAGASDPNSGGFQLYITPGLQYATRRWIVDLGVKVPVVNNLNGTALEPDYAVLTSIRINF